MSSTVTEATSQIYDVLAPLSESDRLKVVRAALVLLGSGDAVEPARTHPERRNPVVSGEPEHSPEDEDSTISAKGRRWMSQNGLTPEMIDECFHVADAQVVTDVPGDSHRIKTVNCYLLVGAAALLRNGEPRFEDGIARALCEHSACYDPTNHSKYIKFGNLIAGDKGKGWTLLAPGLKAAASLVREMSTEVG